MVNYKFGGISQELPINTYFASIGQSYETLLPFYYFDIQTLKTLNKSKMRGFRDSLTLIVALEGCVTP